MCRKGQKTQAPAACQRLRGFFGRFQLKLRMAPASDGEAGVRTPKFWQAFLAETVGTLFLVLLGCGAWIHTRPGTPPDPLRVSATFALTYAALMYSLRYVSGGHINPAVTLAALVTRKVSIARAVAYIIGQCVGAILGAAFLLAVTPSSHRSDLGTTTLSGDVTAEQAFAVELFATLVFAFVIVACWDQIKGEENLGASAPFMIGLIFLAAQLFAFPYTGASLNPARSFGPAIVRVVWRNHWVYWFGPMIGALIGALLYDFIFASTASLRRVRGCLMANEKRRKRTNKDEQPPEEMALRQRVSPDVDDLEIEDEPIKEEDDLVKEELHEERASSIS